MNDDSYNIRYFATFRHGSWPDSETMLEVHAPDTYAGLMKLGDRMKDMDSLKDEEGLTSVRFYSEFHGTTQFYKIGWNWEKGYTRIRQENR